MPAYYNEIDPFAAEWLRALIAAGHIAPGDVDTRSIEDVRPDDLRRYTQCHFFAGIGVWSHALRRAGWADNRPVWTGSCPCQPFSAAGKGGGFDDERHLWPHFHWLISQCRPDVVFGEQVASKDGLAWIDLVSADLEGSGYASGALDFCSASVGAPHIRQRLYWFGERLADTAGGRCSRLGGDREEGASECGPRSRLADAGGSGLEGQDARALGDERETIERSVRSGGLADPKSDRHERGGQFGEPAKWPGTAYVGTDGGLGHAERLGAGRDAGASVGAEGGPLLRPECHDAGSPSPVRGLADADGRKRDGVAEFRRPVRDGSDAGRPESGRELGARRHDDRPGPVNGLWRDADWLFCRDGKWRPVEPGTFPLAHRAPARVGRLRGYGNAIVAEAAVAFIDAYLETKTFETHAVRHLRLTEVSALATDNSVHEGIFS